MRQGPESNALFACWPELAGCVGRVPLGAWPTPVEEAPRAALPDGPSVWIKRDDLSSALFGGNKVRKLELLLAGPPRPVLTFGPRGSHHVLATAVHARALGRSCFAFLVSQPMGPEDEEVAALIVRHAAAVATGAHGLVRMAGEFARMAAFQRGVQVIAPGGTSDRGTLGFAACGLEIAQQIAAGRCPEPRRIYVALGTGGSAAGLALGLALAGVASEVVAVRVATRAVGNLAYLRFLAARAARLLRRAGVRVPRPRVRIAVDHRFIGPGYARPTAAAGRAVEIGRELGLPLETTYTGKAFAALLSDRADGSATGPLMLLATAGRLDALWGLERAPAAATVDK